MNFLDTPIPDQTQLRTLRGVRRYPLDLDSEENKEPAVDLLLSGIAGENYYHRKDNPPYFHVAPGSIRELYVRTGIRERLLRVNELLNKLGYELYVFDAYRPVEVQTYFHDVWVPAYLHEQHPEWSVEKVTNEVGKYWSPGHKSADAIDGIAPPPHATGGVVDCTIMDMSTKEHLCMGSDFDAVTAVSFADHFEREGEIRTLSDNETQARNNRRILYHAMSSQGFIVNPNEWWHFGYGDQLSAQLSGAPHAVYSVLPIPRHLGIKYNKHTVSDEMFEELVREGMEAIPLRFQQKIDNVAIVVADAPTDEQLKANHVPDGDTLLGLYEGIPLTERGEYYGTGIILPDKITVFKFPILEAGGGEIEKIKVIVRDTVWHEFAHYFGYDDNEIEEREEHGTNHSG